MQFCSFYRCVLSLLTLTFTTAPVAALEICPTRAKLHEPVMLSCKQQCSGLLKWNLLSNRDVVLAQCDQKSCKSEEGFSISHDQYLKGDSSLTITEANYSKRNVYACECEDSDFTYVRLVIETVFTPVQIKSDEDLKLKVSVPEPVEVIYKSSDAADEVICNVTKDSLQCKDEYRHRTSLTYPELTLKHMKARDSGRYTILDMTNNEDLQIYAVSVEDKSGFPVWGSVLIVLSLLCCCVGVGIYLLQKNKLYTRLLQVEQLVQQAERGTEENIKEVEMALDQLKQQYSNTKYSDKVNVFCNEQRKQLQQHQEHLKRGVLERRLHQVDQLVQQAKEVTEEKVREAKKSLDQLKKQYEESEYSDKVSVFCMAKRKQLLNSQMLPVEQLVQQAEEGKEENIREAEEGITQLGQQNTEYSDEVTSFCSAKWRQLNWYRLQHSNDERLMTERRELNSHLLHVDQIVQQAEEGSNGKIREAEKKLEQLEQQYRYKDYSEQIKFLCRVKREQLKRYSLQPSIEQHLITGDRELNSQLKHVEWLVQQAKEGKVENIREVKMAIDHLEQQQYLNTENVVPVTPICMLKRAELFWYRLQHSDDKCLKAEKIEIKMKVEKVMDSVHKLRNGAEQKQEILSSRLVDEMEEYLKEIEKWCGQIRREIPNLIQQHRCGAV
ncbi:involucrin-like isoform X2 [Tachysurus fulvidraco]|uniref:involucrin-like isoform X2 n=1 Tax=Tachysurus fulvidraco TaxID=1234273 RepID=UPI001FEE7709|nr:involucrin-like isoform X2 [Tachysurus fulvidraco]